MRIFLLLTRKETRRFNFRHVTRAAQGGPDPGPGHALRDRQPRRDDRATGAHSLTARFLRTPARDSHSIAHIIDDARRRRPSHSPIVWAGDSHPDATDAPGGRQANTITTCYSVWPPLRNQTRLVRRHHHLPDLLHVAHGGSPYPSTLSPFRAVYPTDGQVGLPDRVEWRTHPAATDEW